MAWQYVRRGPKWVRSPCTVRGEAVGKRVVQLHKVEEAAAVTGGVGALPVEVEAGPPVRLGRRREGLDVRRYIPHRRERIIQAWKNTFNDGISDTAS